MPEDSGHIELASDAIRYVSATYASWTVCVEDVRVIGEATNQNGPFADDYFLCFATGPQVCHEASFYASGRDAFLVAISARVGSSLECKLAASTDFESRVLWPAELAGQPMFHYEDVPSKNVLGRVLGSALKKQTYTEHVLAILEQ